MSQTRVIDVKMGVFDANDRIAQKIRRQNKKNGTFMVDLMGSPGAGKTTLLLRTVEALKERYRIGVIEADIDATVDAEKMEEAGVRVIQAHTGGECSMDASMTAQALEHLVPGDLDLLFLENVGNLVCTAEQDTGATVNVEVLSVPEGDDKPLKYPLMFQVCQAVVISKTDTKGVFHFNEEALRQRIRDLNPKVEIISLSAKTGEGVDRWLQWLEETIRAMA